MEIGLIFHDKYNAFFQKKQVQVENERWNNSLICRASLEGNGSGQYLNLNDSETQERKGGIKIQRIPWGSMPPIIPLRSLKLEPLSLVKQIGQYVS